MSVDLSLLLGIQRTWSNIWAKRRLAQIPGNRLAWAAEDVAMNCNEFLRQGVEPSEPLSSRLQSGISLPHVPRVGWPRGLQALLCGEAWARVEAGFRALPPPLQPFLPQPEQLWSVFQVKAPHQEVQNLLASGSGSHGSDSCPGPFGLWSESSRT